MDPRSKILATYLLILGVAISIDFFQIFLYLLLFIPMLVTYKPKLIFLKRMILSIPIILFISGILFLGLRNPDVTIVIFGYSRTYKKLKFIALIAYRYIIILLYNYALLYSEDSHTDIIEALASFRLGTTFVSILLLIKRISTRVIEDYNKMTYAAKTKGAFARNFILILYLKMIILGRVLVRSVNYGETITESLLARGFHDYFQSSTRPWTSEGVTIVLIAFVFFIDITIIPWLR